MATKKIPFHALLGLVASELGFNNAIADTIEPDQHDEVQEDESTLRSLCVSEVLKEDSDQVYRFCTDDHDATMPGSHRYSYNELLRRWDKKDPRCKKDGGSFPDVLRSWEWPQDEAWVEYKCTRCSGGDPKLLWCEIYRFNVSSRSNDTIMIHKFPCAGKTWAVILGQFDDLDWLLWGHVDKDRPDAMYWNNQVLLAIPLSYVTPVNGLDKPIAQQRIGPTDVRHESFSVSDNTKDKDSTARRERSDGLDEQQSPVHSNLRNFGEATRHKPIKVVHDNQSNHRIPQRSRTSKSDEFQSGSTSDEEPLMRKRTRRSLNPSAVASTSSPSQRQPKGRELRGFGSRPQMSNISSRQATATEPSQRQDTPRFALNAIQSEDNIGDDSMHISSSTELIGIEQSVDVTSTPTCIANVNSGSTASVRSDVVTSHIQQAQPQPTNDTLDFSARQDEVYSRVLERGMIVPGTKVANALESLDAAASAHKESLFRRVYGMLSRELVKEGAEQLPAL